MSILEKSRFATDRPLVSMFDPPTFTDSQVVISMTKLATASPLVALLLAAPLFAQDATAPLPTEPMPQPTPWTFQRQTQNQAGTVINSQQRLDAPEEGRYVREHMVTNPRGEMTQSYERFNTDEGYGFNRSQTWTAPDGTVMRQHQQSLSGTDPNNYTRQHMVTLPDGRVVSQTQVRTWDGTNGTMERSFVGPNGQTRETVRNWSPDGEVSPATLEASRATQDSFAARSTQPTTSAPAEKVSWWQRLNPFSKNGRETSAAAKTATPRGGFTIGAGRSDDSFADSGQGQGQGQSQAARSGFDSTNHPSMHASQNTHRPSWAGSTPRAVSPQVRGNNGGGSAASVASRASSAPGRNR